jgi:hypothetical protein
MNKLQKMAWYQLTVIVVTLSATAAAVAILNYKHGMPTAKSGLGVLGFLGLLGLSNIIFRPRKNKVEFDERDVLIQKRSTTLAYSVFWVIFVLGSMIAWSIIGSESRISVNVLPLMVISAAILVVTIQSVAILVQYGWKVKEKNHE